ncbi:MAG: NAD(+)/NADH kinase [Acidobacteria bacterium]|nr:NAD(+)/NADH kinase [Acidobacteriota bacterium]
MIRKVGIVSKPGRADTAELLARLLPWLDKHGVAHRLDRVSARYLGLEDGFDRASLDDEFDLMIVLGGDGTLLSVARGVGKRETPLLAVNMGGLGFMMTTGQEEIFAVLEETLEGNFEVQCRTVLEAKVIRGGASIASYLALNDVVVNKAAIARLLQLEIFINDEFMCTYRADGLILSTPTGSTAYSLAAGGPIMLPSVEALCVTPICPHTLSNRPVVVPESARIQVVFQGGDDTTYMTVDGQVGLNLQIGDRIEAAKASHCVRVVQPKNVRFFDVLRSKMHWGGR